MDIDQEHCAYFDSINRGGLIFPSNFLFNILLCSYCIFNLCIFERFVGAFLAAVNQKHTLVASIEHYISSNEKYICISECFCDVMIVRVNGL